MILGLDISTSVVGICLLDGSGDVKSLSYIDLRKVKNFWEKAKRVEVEIRALKHAFDDSFGKDAITHVFVEENLSRFRPGFSSAQTLLVLARFNGIVSYIVTAMFEIDAEYVNVNEARRLASIKIDRKNKEKTTKEKVFDEVSKRISFEWIHKTMKSGNSRGLIKFDDCNYDMCDAWVIATAGLKRSTA